MEWQEAPDIHNQLKKLVLKLKLSHIHPGQIICFRSYGSSSRARARIWSLPRVWQLALNIKPHYVVEVLSEKFDRLNSDDKTRVLIHELMHIPKTFSGALSPHHGRFHAINHRSVEMLFQQYMKNN